MMNRALNQMLTVRPSMEGTRGHFLNYFEMMQLFGPLNTLALYEYAFQFESSEEALAIALLGAVWGVQQLQNKMTNSIPDDLEAPATAGLAWEWVLKLVGDDWSKLPATTATATATVETPLATAPQP